MCIRDSHSPKPVVAPRKRPSSRSSSTSILPLSFALMVLHYYWAHLPRCFPASVLADLCAPPEERSRQETASTSAATIPGRYRLMCVIFAVSFAAFGRGSSAQRTASTDAGKHPVEHPRGPTASHAPEATSPERSSSSRSGTAARRSSPSQAPARADAAGRSAGRGCPCWWSSPRSAPIPRRSG